MWFEARKQEKKIRTIMVNHKRRAERRKDFYDKIRREPAEFMQLHGGRCKIHMDPAISKAAESSSCFRGWQGDSSILIDRFDARSHLDHIPEVKKKKDQDSPGDDTVSGKEERRMVYERYRVLVVNDFEKMSEDKCLKTIALIESGAIPTPGEKSALVKAEQEKKKKLAEQKAAIAFTYEDSTAGSSKGGHLPTKGKNSDSDESSEDSGEESDPEGLDVTLDVSSLKPEESRELTRHSLKYGIKDGDFLKFMWQDKEEEGQLEELRGIEEARAALAGKGRKSERRLLKQKRLLLISQGNEATTMLSASRKKSPPNFLKELMSRDSSSSRSPSPDDERGKVEFITTFQENKQSDDEKKPRVQGPAPPPREYKKFLALRKDRSKSPDFLINKESRRRSSSRSRSRSRSRSKRRRRERSSSRPRSDRYRSIRSSHRSRRSRSRSPRRSHRSPRRSRATRSRSHSRSKNGSEFTKPEFWNDRTTASSRDTKPKPKDESPKISKRDRSPSSSRSPPGKRTPPSHSSDSSPVGSDLAIRSSQSESEQERRQVENRRRRMKRTKKAVKAKGGRERKRSRSASSDNSERSSGKVLSLREKLRLQTQKALKKTLNKAREDELQRQREEQRERIERDEEMREISSLRRQKERDKRYEAREEYDRLLEEERKRSDGSHKRKRTPSTSSSSSSS